MSKTLSHALPHKSSGGSDAKDTVVGRLDIVPYIRTFVQYDGTFGASDQDQMLDV